MSSTSRQAVIVLGMHRSGTSALAGTLARLGFGLPKTPLDASPDNPEGFYESWPVVEMNFQFLMTAKCAWNVTFNLSPEVFFRQFDPRKHNALITLLQNEFGDTGSFVLKDPRMCLLLPVWLPALQRLAPSLPMLLMLRHPAEIVQSHAARNGRPEWETLLNWMHHMLEAEYITRNVPRALLQYAGLLRDWRATLGPALRRAGITPPRTLEQAAPQVDAFLSNTLRHHEVTEAGARIGPPQYAPMIDATWRALSALASNPQDNFALGTLDDLRGNLALIRQDLMDRGAEVVMESPVSF